MYRTHALAYDLGNACFNDGAVALIDNLSLDYTHVNSDYLTPFARKAGCRHAADITQSENADFMLN